MARPLSPDLRQRIAAAAQNGESKLAAARRFGVCNKTAANYLELDDAGSLEPKKRAQQPWRKLAGDALDAMKSWLKEKNGLALKQLQRRLAVDFRVQVSHAAIGDRLAAMNLTWEKNGPCLRTGAPGRPGASGKMAGGSRRHAGGQAGVR